jgi:pimeloyl-ACP methyl ester carboxylesterase
MVLFILFPGGGCDESYWNITSTNKNCHFLDKLKEIGDVYTYTPESNYIKQNNFRKLNLTLEYLDLEHHCEQIYNKVKHIHTPYIPIGHSLGAFFAMKFANKYKKLCKAVILLDPSTMRAIPAFVKDKPDYKILLAYDDSKILELVNKIKNKYTLGTDPEDEIETLQLIIYYNVLKQYKSVSLALDVPCAVFINVDDVTPTNAKEKDVPIKYSIIRKFFLNQLIKKNINNIYMYHFVNATHYIHWTNPEGIIEKIKPFV